ncbi:hypothetical protein Tco_0001432 [Tanacetum coccineum]
MNGNWNKRRIDDSILSSNNTTSDSFFKPYLKTRGKSDIEKEDEQSQTKRKYSNTSSSIDEQPNKRRCKAENFEAIQYSLGPNKEYIAIRSYEYDIWERNEDNLSIIHLDIFQKKDERWKVTRTKVLYKVEDIATYLVEYVKFWDDWEVDRYGNANLGDLDNSTSNVLIPLDSWTSGLLVYKLPLSGSSFSFPFLVMSKRNLSTITCSLSQSNLVDFVDEYGISLCYDPKLPSSNATALDAPKGYIPLYMSLFSIGNLRFPLNNFCLDVFEFFWCHFPLLNPFGVARVTTFVVSCKAYGGEARGSFAYPYPMEPFDEVLRGRLCHHPFKARNFSDPILYLVGLTDSWEHAPSIPSILIDEEVESSSHPRDKGLIGHELVVVGESCSEQDVLAVKGSKKRRSIIEALEEEVIVVRPVSKKKKPEGSRRVSVKGSVPPLPITTPKGVGKHPQVLARYIGNLASGSDSLAPDVEEAYAAHNMISGLHYPLLKDKLGFLTFDELVNVYDVHAVQMVVVGNMLTNESKIMSQDYPKLKNDLVSLNSKKSLLEHEMSKLEGQLAKAQKNQDVKGSHVVKDLRSENALNLEEMSMLRRVAASSEESRKKLVEEMDGLQSPAKLEKSKLVKDFLPLHVKKLFESEHFNQALGDLQQKAIMFGMSQALDKVHGLGDSWDLKDVQDYHPEAKNIFDEAAEAFYKLEFPYISLLVENVGLSSEELASLEAPLVQEAPLP